MNLQVQKIKNSTEPSDEFCISKFCEDRDEAAFNCLVNKYRGSIRRILYTVFRGALEDFEDLEQEILLSLYRDLPRFSFRSSFRTYLFRICRNKAVDFIRKSKRDREMNEKVIKFMNPADPDTPETKLLRESRITEIQRAVFQLGEKDRSLILMKDVEGLSVSEIAEIFRKPEGTIKSGLHRARKKAAEILLEAEEK